MVECCVWEMFCLMVSKSRNMQYYNPTDVCYLKLGVDWDFVQNHFFLHSEWVILFI